MVNTIRNIVTDLETLFLTTRDTLQWYRYEKSHMVLDTSLHSLIEYWKNRYNWYN